MSQSDSKVIDFPKKTVVSSTLDASVEKRRARQEKKYEQMNDEVRRRYSTEFWDDIEKFKDVMTVKQVVLTADLHEFLIEHGYLSFRQCDVLDDIAQSARKKFTKLRRN